MADYRCDPCIRIQLGSPEPSYEEDNPCFKHHLRGYDLRDAASKGCLFCQYLWGTLSPPERLILCPPGGEARKAISSMPASFQIFRRGTSMNQYTLLYKFPSPPKPLPSAKLPQVVNGICHDKPIRRQVRLVPTREIFEEAELKDYGTFRPGASNWSDQTIRQIGGWIRECAGESGSSDRHRSCASIGSLKWTPMRLLAVGTLQSPVLKLHLQQDVAPGHHYMTLSHCWGGVSAVTLTTQNIESFKADIPFDSLPKTFQDAITVTRTLEVPYLWIDALCILQDSKDDWRMQSAMMGNVYSFAFCNIATTKAFDSKEGCFVDRSNTNIKAPIITQYRAAKEPKKVRLNIVKRIMEQVPETYYKKPPSLPANYWGMDGAPQPGEYAILDPDLWTREILDAPLSQRGWAFQERILAPRTIHFGSSQVFFECKTHRACEAFPLGLPEVITCDVLPKLSGVRIARANVRPPFGPPPNIPRTWGTIVSQYSRCQLTNQSDKLIALSGLAKRLESQIPGGYIAGLWKANIPVQLLWHIKEGCQLSPPKEYQAPTWSWASVNSEVERIVYQIPALDDYEDLAQVLDGKANLAGKDEFGQVTGGYLKLRGQILPAKLHLLPPYQGDETQRPPETHSLSIPDFPPSPNPIFTTAVFDTTDSTTDHEFILAPILDIPGSETLEGLILDYAGDANNENESLRFKRIGVFRVTSSHRFGLLDVIREAFNHGLMKCDEENGGRFDCHTFTII